jgi:hypothetical protein
VLLSPSDHVSVPLMALIGGAGCPQAVQLVRVKLQ